VRWPVSWNGVLGGEGLKREGLLGEVDSVDVRCAKLLCYRLLYDVTTKLGDISGILETSAVLDACSDSDAWGGLLLSCPCNGRNRNSFPAKEDAR